MAGTLSIPLMVPDIAIVANSEKAYQHVYCDQQLGFILVKFFKTFFSDPKFFKIHLSIVCDSQVLIIITLLWSLVSLTMDRLKGKTDKLSVTLIPRNLYFVPQAYAERHAQIIYWRQYIHRLDPFLSGGPKSYWGFNNIGHSQTTKPKAKFNMPNFKWFTVYCYFRLKTTDDG